MIVKRIMCLCICISVTGILQAQYNPDNHVVTISKYYLKAMSDIEDGSSEERKEAFEEEAKKMNPLKEKLISSMVLGHYWSGASNEVIELNEWASIADADETIKASGETRKKAWRKDEDRKEFMKKFNKYWVGKHTDLQILELNMNRFKRSSRKHKDDTFVTMVEYTLVPISDVEDGSAEEREELLQAHFDNIVKKDDTIISYMQLQHYWSGSAGGPEGWPIIIITEYTSIEDALNEDNSALWEAAWPDEEERKAFGSKLFPYWGFGGHKDLGLHTNKVNLSK